MAASHALQRRATGTVGAAGVALHTQGVDHRIRNATDDQGRGGSGQDIGQVDRSPRAQVEYPGPTGLLAAVAGVGIEGEAVLCTRSGDVGVDVDVVRGGESEDRAARAAVPTDGVIDIDVATAAAGALARQNGDAAAVQRGAQRGARDVAAGRAITDRTAVAGGDGEIVRVDQPGTGLSAAG